MSKCRGKLCANCTEQYCEVVLDLEIGEEIFEEDEIVVGEVGMFEEWEPWRNVKSCWDFYESEWRM